MKSTYVDGAWVGRVTMTYAIRWEGKGCVHIRYFGIVSDRMVAHAENQIQANERFDALLYELHDFLECEAFSCSGETVEYMAATSYAASLSNSRLVLVIVARNREVISMFKEYLRFDFGGAPVEIFNDMSAARTWMAHHRIVCR